MKNVIISSMLAATILAGCVTSGNQVLKGETKESVGEKLRVGMSPDEAIALFGEPKDVTFTDSGNEVWQYKFTEGQIKAKSLIPYYSLIDSGSKGTTKTLVLFFNDETGLVRHTMAASDIDNNVGIFK